MKVLGAQGNFGPDGGLLSLVRRILLRDDSTGPAPADSFESAVSLRSLAAQRLQHWFTLDRSPSTTALPTEVQESSSPSGEKADERWDSPPQARNTPPTDSLDMPLEFMDMVRSLECRFTQGRPTSTEILPIEVQRSATAHGGESDEASDFVRQPKTTVPKDSPEAGAQFIAACSAPLAAKDAIAASRSVYSETETSLEERAEECERHRGAVSSPADSLLPSLRQLQVDTVVSGLSPEVDSERRHPVAETRREFEELRGSAETFADNVPEQLGATVRSALDSRLKAAVEKARAGLDAFEQNLVEDIQKQLASMSQASLETLKRDLITQVRAELRASRQASIEDTENRLAEMTQSSLQSLQSQAAGCVEQVSAHLTDAGKEFFDEARQRLAGMMQASLEPLARTIVEQGREELNRMMKESLVIRTPQIEAELRESMKGHSDGVQPLATPPRNTGTLLAPVRPIPIPKPEHQREFALTDDVPKRRVDLSEVWTGLVWGVRLGLACGLILLAMLAIYLSSSPVVRLRPNPPLAFFDDSRGWTARQRARQDQLARAYWDIAVQDVETKYGFGTTLPVNPPDDFKVEEIARSGTVSKVDLAARARYWERLREVWPQSDSWERTSGWNLGWIHNH